MLYLYAIGGTRHLEILSANILLEKQFFNSVGLSGYFVEEPSSERASSLLGIFNTQ